MSLRDWIRTDTASDGHLTREVLDKAIRDGLYYGLNEDQKLALDARIYGFTVIKDGRRIPPWTVS